MSKSSNDGYGCLFVFIILIAIIMALVNNCSSKDEQKKEQVTSNTSITSIENKTGHDWVNMSEIEKQKSLEATLYGYRYTFKDSKDINVRSDNQWYVNQLNDFYLGKGSDSTGRLDVSLEDALKLIVASDSTLRP